MFNVPDISKEDAKNKILESLVDYPEIPVEKIWDQIIEIIGAFFQNIDSGQNVAEIHSIMIQDSIDLFDGYILSESHGKIVINFISDTIFWFQDYLKEPKTKSDLMGNNKDKKNTSDENNIEVLETRTDIKITHFNDRYESIMFPVRTAVNIKIHHELDQSKIIRFLELLELPTRVIRNQEDLYYLAVGYLLHGRLFSLQTPFDDFLRKLSKQKKVNREKLIYINSFKREHTSLFIIENIDRENNIGWLRDVFNEGRLYPVIDISLTRNNEALFRVFHCQLLPVFQTKKGVNVYIHNGSTTNYNFIPDVEKIKYLIDEPDFSLKKTAQVVKEDFLKEYEYLKNQYWKPVASKVMDAGFIGDLQVLEKYYLTLKGRTFETGSIGKKL